jgi:hypothetical protein
VLAGSGDEGEGLGLLALTLVAISRLEAEEAQGYGRRALAVFRALRHTWGVTTSLLVLAHVAINRRSGEVAALLRESADLRRCPSTIHPCSSTTTGTAATR